MTAVRAGRTGGNVALHVEDGGDGAPVLMITGLGYAVWCWSQLRERLQALFRIITFDNRGTGRSDKPAGPYSMELMADDAAAVLAHAGVDRAHVVGHSMGGYIALTLALRHPRLVRSLALISTSPGGPDTAGVPEETQIAWREASKLPLADNIRSTMPRSFSRGWTEAHPQAFEDFLRRRLEHPTPYECWLAQYQACAQFIVGGAPVGNIQAPALVIHGEDDRIVPVANGRLLAQRLPRARYVELPGGGHLPYFEDPDGVARLLAAHWQDHNKE